MWERLAAALANAAAENRYRKILSNVNLRFVYNL